MDRARPTLRCLRTDLNLAVPPVDQPLDEIDHPLLAKANQHFADTAVSRERIAAIDDMVLFKVKVRRWRGAVWADEPTTAIRFWLVAGGIREDGAATDFYAALANAAKQARVRYNTKHVRPLKTECHTAWLLPDDADRQRYRAESAARFERKLAQAVYELCRRSLLNGQEHAAAVGNAVIGIQVRADHGHETYVAVRVVGSVPAALVATVLDLVPGCELDGWFPEYALPDRVLEAAEQAWSNLMDPITAAKVLESAS